MPQWQVLRVRREVFIIGLRSDDSAGVRHQLIDSHAADFTYKYLEDHCHYWWYLSRLLTVFIIDW